MISKQQNKSLEHKAIYSGLRPRYDAIGHVTVRDKLAEHQFLTGKLSKNIT